MAHTIGHRKLRCQFPALWTIGITLLMVSGEFDLSIGPMIAMSGFLFGTVSVGAESQITRGLSAVGLPVAEGSGNLALALILALAVPALMGLVNGLMLIWTRIPSFIVTLGTRQIFRGLVWLTSGGHSFADSRKAPALQCL